MKLLQWNLENFFISLDTYNNENIETLTEAQWQRMSIAKEPNKQLAKIQEIAEMVLKQNPDVCVFSEVGGKPALEIFNQYFLNNQYSVFMSKSNSRRGIDIGFLVKKDCPYKVKIKSNRYHPLHSKMEEKATKFSRDIPELRFYQEDKMKLIVMGVHFKSKASLGDDYFGVETRASEVRGLVEIYNRVKNKYQVPIIVAGDFNGTVVADKFESEFSPIFDETSLRDFHEYKENLQPEDRVSFVRVDPYTLNQLDYILIDKDLVSKVNLEVSRILRFTTFYDIEMPLPTSLTEKKKLPSDHYPQVIEFSLD